MKLIQKNRRFYLFILNLMSLAMTYSTPGNADTSALLNRTYDNNVIDRMLRIGYVISIGVQSEALSDLKNPDGSPIEPPIEISAFHKTKFNEYTDDIEDTNKPKDNPGLIVTESANLKKSFQLFTFRTVALSSITEMNPQGIMNSFGGLGEQDLEKVQTFFAGKIWSIDAKYSPASRKIEIEGRVYLHWPQLAQEEPELISGSGHNFMYALARAIGTKLTGRVASSDRSNIPVSNTAVNTAVIEEQADHSLQSESHPRRSSPDKPNRIQPQDAPQEPQNRPVLFNGKRPVRPTVFPISATDSVTHHGLPDTHAFRLQKLSKESKESGLGYKSYMGKVMLDSLLNTILNETTVSKL